uniref:Sulphite or nitrite reductase, ferredoxin dependent n=1 Tax=Ectopseudomonas oleovorans TaxID=301 RepID=A6GV63_ECTOL|nr:sulphite or nitrite reductase, ferredoxin dependent [Pseudomonas oleovorans CECT 5344]
MKDHHLISANRLDDGAVVWLNDALEWVDTLELACAFDDERLEGAKLAAEHAVGQNLIVGPTPRAAQIVEGLPLPIDYREQLRSRGPSVRPDLGKQAESAGVLSTVRERPVVPVEVAHAGVYRYDPSEREFLKTRAQQFEQQVARRLSGELDEEAFKVYRLMNGLYLQLHGYMLRVAIPYGTLSAIQMRQLAYVAKTYDKGYGHFTTRQNMQFNWPRLSDSPEILSVLADADLHCIQTSGNCIRNVTTDHFAGAALDEVVDPRVHAEILRQWSTDHPEFTYLPRKFKIAITGSPVDRAAVRFHDIGILARKNDAGEVGFQIYAGGGLGRTPIVGTKVRDWLPERELLRYVEAILRVYNTLGRRDNIYKARIKILVRELKPAKFIEMIEDEFTNLPADRQYLEPDIVQAVRERFVALDFAELSAVSPEHELMLEADPEFGHWVRNNTHPHRCPGYISAVISLKPAGGIPGDISAEEMVALADLAQTYSLNEIRVSHEQNLVLPHVELSQLYTVWKALRRAGLATPNIGLISDSIACPGMDYCSLATARSVPVAQRIALRFDEAKQREIGELKLNVSGCINACAHHHVAHIGILGLDKSGKESYQISLGGSADESAAVGTILGPSVGYDSVPDVIEAIVDTYLKNRSENETFIDTYRRVGIGLFKEALHDTH